MHIYSYTRIDGAAALAAGNRARAYIYRVYMCIHIHSNNIANMSAALAAGNMALVYIEHTCVYIYTQTLVPMGWQLWQQRIWQESI